MRERIAVIYAQGPVLYGEGSENIIGQEVFLKAIDQAVKSRRVKAIVLRVDSPGGSALSSDIIWEGFSQSQKRKTPSCFYGECSCLWWILFSSCRR